MLDLSGIFPLVWLVPYIRWIDVCPHFPTKRHGTRGMAAQSILPFLPVKLCCVTCAKFFRGPAVCPYASQLPASLALTIIWITPSRNSACMQVSHSPLHTWVQCGFAKWMNESVNYSINQDQPLIKWSRIYLLVYTGICRAGRSNESLAKWKPGKHYIVK